MQRLILYIGLLYFMLYACGPDEDMKIEQEEECEHIEKDCGQLKTDGVDESYNYPIKPGTPEWKEFDSHQDMIDAVQVPKCILENMCTYGLVETCFNCPLFGEFYMSNQINTGLIDLENNINSFYELATREDAATELKDKYISMHPDSLNENWTGYQKFEFVLFFCLVEHFISQKKYLGKLMTDQSNELLTDAYNKLVEKKKLEFEKIIHLEAYAGSVRLLGNILYYNIGFEPFIEYVDNDQNVKNFIIGGRWTTDQNVDSTKHYTRVYLSTITQ